MDLEQLKALAAQIGKGIRSEAELNEVTRQMTKMVAESALGAELTEHLGSERHQSSVSGNTRNGFSKKKLKGDHGEVLIDVPRDRDSTFEPHLVKKHQTRLTAMDDQILFLYA